MARRIRTVITARVMAERAVQAMCSKHCKDATDFNDSGARYKGLKWEPPIKTERATIFTDMGELYTRKLPWQR